MSLRPSRQEDTTAKLGTTNFAFNIYKAPNEIALLPQCGQSAGGAIYKKELTAFYETLP